MSDDCIFCKIVRGEAPAHLVWEDEKHIAFLTIFPNTEGFTVVATKAHQPSYIFNVSDETITDIVHAAKFVARKIDAAFPDVGRTGLIFEGFGVDHLHAKLFPMHGTKDESWRARLSSVKKYFENYEGYISSHNYERADDTVLAAIAKKIRLAKP